MAITAVRFGYETGTSARHERARASTNRALKPRDLQRERAGACPRVDARPLLVFPS
jgi:hypothetical protein